MPYVPAALSCRDLVRSSEPTTGNFGNDAFGRMLSILYYYRLSALLLFTDAPTLLGAVRLYDWIPLEGGAMGFFFITTPGLDRTPSPVVPRDSGCCVNFLPLIDLPGISEASCLPLVT